ncbi:MAG: vitamin B12 dependent-methionine synthase activation domain-containing protein [Prevotella sp.]|jgi:cobalamin-dependent methionine synthase I
MKLDYQLKEVRPYINWLYFFFAWGLSGKPQSEKDALRKEAEQMLDQWEGRFRTHALFLLATANSDGDDIIADGVRIPMLRQQHAANGKPNLCMADFIRPLSKGVTDKVGLFACTVDSAMERSGGDDPYLRMMSQTLSDRLAEATAERLHLDVRRKYWGYAPNEHLSTEDLLMERYQGIRPAVGYPSLPDTSMNFLLDSLLDMAQIGIRLTESGMMSPHASVSGFMMAHPKAHYFELGSIGEDQLRDYARRRGLPVETMRRFLQTSLNNSQQPK